MFPRHEPPQRPWVSHVHQAAAVAEGQRRALIPWAALLEGKSQPLYGSSCLRGPGGADTVRLPARCLLYK